MNYEEILLKFFFCKTLLTQQTLSLIETKIDRGNCHHFFTKFPPNLEFSNDTQNSNCDLIVDGTA